MFIIIIVYNNNPSKLQVIISINAFSEDVRLLINNYINGETIVAMLRNA